MLQAVKPRVLPSTRLKARPGIPDSQPRLKAARPLGPRAVRPGSSVSRGVRATPERAAQGTKKKACSTPTSDEATLPDNTLDFSVITGRWDKLTNIYACIVQIFQFRAGGGNLEETVNVAPVMKMAPGARTRPGARLPPRMTPSARKGDSRTSVKTAAKQADILEEAEDEDEVTDEMLDGAYTR